MNQIQQNQPEKIPWLLFLIFFTLFFFIDGHKIFKSVDQGSSIEDTISKSEEGRLDRRIGLFSLFGFALISLMRKNRNNIRINGYMGWLILIFLTWTLYSLAWAENFSLTAKRIVVLFMLFFTSFAVAERFSIRTLMLWIFFSTSGFVLLGLITEIATGNFNPHLSEYRFAGTHHANHMAIYCALLLMSGVCLLEYFPKYKKLLISIMLFGAFFLFLTKSRTSFISTLAAISTFSAVRLSNANKIAIVISSTIVICLLLIFAGDTIFPSAENAALMGREQSTEGVTSFTGRVPVWKTCFGYINKRPLHGYGYGGFWSRQRIREISEREYWNINESHSAYIEIALGLGIVGLVFYILLLFGGIKQSIIYYKHTKIIDYLFWILLLLFCTINGALESAVVLPSMIMFLRLVALMHLGFIIEPQNKEIISL